MQVLNAQLQAVYSLRKYVAKTHDASAATLARRLQRAAAATLPQFDTGYWTYYSLPSRLSNLHYQDYVVRLLRKLSSADPRFADAATRFAAYRRQPPAIQARGGTPRRASLLAVEACADDRLGRRADAAPLARRRLAHAGLEQAAARRHLSDRAQRRRRGGKPRVVPGTAARPRRARSAHAGGPRDELDGEGAARASRRGGLHDPLEAVRAQRLGLRLMRVRVGWPTGASRPELALAAAFQPLAGASTLVELRVRRLPANHREKRALAKYAAAVAQHRSRRPPVLPRSGGPPEDGGCVRCGPRCSAQGRAGGVAGRSGRPARRRAASAEAGPSKCAPHEARHGRHPARDAGERPDTRKARRRDPRAHRRARDSQAELRRGDHGHRVREERHRRRSRPAHRQRRRARPSPSPPRPPSAERSSARGSRRRRGRARSISRRSSRPRLRPRATRLRPRLPLPGHARRRARPPRRRAEGLAPRREPRR